MSEQLTSCLEAQNFLYRFLDNELYCFHEGEAQDIGARSQIERHFQLCPGCAELVALEAAHSAKLRAAINQSCNQQAPAELISAISISIHTMAAAMNEFYQPSAQIPTITTIQTTHIVIHLEPQQFFFNGLFFVEIESYQTHQGDC
jgi:hypothetical protein